MAWYNDERRINYDDDLVVVYNPDGGVDYKGISDDNPYKYDEWEFDDDEGVYYLDSEYGTSTMEKILV